jgi:hypothetical protein
VPPAIFENRRMIWFVCRVPCCASCPDCHERCVKGVNDDRRTIGATQHNVAKRSCLAPQDFATTPCELGTASPDDVEKHLQHHDFVVALYVGE